jgi:hypothetical protein
MHRNLRIAAFNKARGASAYQSGPVRHVVEAKLPAELVSEFARLTDGIVPAVTLAALTAVRADTIDCCSRCRRASTSATSVTARCRPTRTTRPVTSLTWSPPRSPR